MKRKHCELIKAWADGAEIEYWNVPYKEWAGVQFDIPEYQYRIKPSKTLAELDRIRADAYEVYRKAKKEYDAAVLHRTPTSMAYGREE